MEDVFAVSSTAGIVIFIEGNKLTAIFRPLSLMDIYGTFWQFCVDSFLTSFFRQIDNQNTHMKSSFPDCVGSVFLARILPDQLPQYLTDFPDERLPCLWSHSAVLPAGRTTCAGLRSRKRRRRNHHAMTTAHPGRTSWRWRCPRRWPRSSAAAPTARLTTDGGRQRRRRHRQRSHPRRQRGRQGRQRQWVMLTPAAAAAAATVHSRRLARSPEAPAGVVETGLIHETCVGGSRTSGATGGA